MTVPNWLIAARMDPLIYNGLREHIAEQIARLQQTVAEDAKDFEGVLLARGGLRELRLLQSLLERKEKEDAVRRTLDRKLHATN